MLVTLLLLSLELTEYRGIRVDRGQATEFCKNQFELFEKGGNWTIIQESAHLMVTFGKILYSMHLSKRVGHVVPGVVVWPCLMGWCFT